MERKKGASRTKKKQEKHCNGPLFTYISTRQGVKYRLVLGKNHLKVV